ncbi:hypothetical protein N431DRAFT_440268 [Stipitochalara longipes BDJ]|nr:hypothetical protein N431DRAFT_440268 [Stipitochalara longipes BDJ]
MCVALGVLGVLGVLSTEGQLLVGGGISCRSAMRELSGDELGRAHAGWKRVNSTSATIGRAERCGYSQITDHINAQTPSRRGLLLCSPAPATTVGGTSAVAEAVKARIWCCWCCWCCCGRPELSFFNACLAAGCWTVPRSSQYRAAEVSRCRRWSIEVPAHPSVPNQSRDSRPRPGARCASDINFGRSGEAKLPPTLGRPSDENRSVPASFLGLLEIDRLAERQEEAFVLFRILNTAFGRAARCLHTL